MDTEITEGLDALVDLPPLEECIFPSGEGDEDESWDFAAALEMIFESDKNTHGGKHTYQESRSGDSASMAHTAAGRWQCPFPLADKDSMCLRPGGGAAQQNSHQQQTGDWCSAKLEMLDDDDDSPLKLFYDDALQR